MSGGSKIKPYRAPNYIVVRQTETLRVRRQQMIARAATPPPLPLPAPIKKSIPDTPSFNQFAYSVLLIAIMAGVAVATPFINWMFLVYGVLAVIVRLPSRIVFISAFVCIIVTAISSAFSRESLSNTFAIMTFYFMLIGLVRAILEVRPHDLAEGKP